LIVCPSSTLVNAAVDEPFCGLYVLYSADHTSGLENLDHSCRAFREGFLCRIKHEFRVKWLLVRG
jgi:hypothetical protein